MNGLSYGFEDELYSIRLISKAAFSLKIQNSLLIFQKRGARWSGGKIFASQSGDREIKPHNSHLEGKMKMDSGKPPAHKCPTSPQELSGRTANQS